MHIEYILFFGCNNKNMKCFCICLSVVHAILKYMNIHKSMYMIVYAHVRCMFFNDTVKHKSKQEAGSTCSPFRGSVVSTCIVQDKIRLYIWLYIWSEDIWSILNYKKWCLRSVWLFFGHHFGSLIFHQRFHRSKIWGADVQVPKIKLFPTMVATSQDAVQCRSFVRNRKIQLMRGSDLKQSWESVGWVFLSLLIFTFGQDSTGESHLNCLQNQPKANLQVANGLVLS